MHIHTVAPSQGLFLTGRGEKYTVLIQLYNKKMNGK
jgi:hypothetical protein